MMIECLTDLPVGDRVRRVADERYSWPGGYTLGIIAADGGVICGECVSANRDLILEATTADDDDQWAAVAAFVADADDDDDDDDGGPSPTCCDHCSRPI